MKLELVLEILTPVQVGSGVDMLLDLDFINRDKLPYVVDQNHCFEMLAAGSGVGAENSRTLTALVGSLGDSAPGYELRSLHGNPCKPQQIRQQIKDASWRPLIPGSSLKGAIRTALFAEYLRSSGSEEFRQRNIPRARGNPKMAAKSLSDAYFSPGAKGGKEPNHDWMRAWKVGDSSFGLSDLTLADVRFLNLAPDLKWKNMAGRNSVADWQGASGVYVECLQPGSVSHVQIGIDDLLLHDKLAQKQLNWQADTLNTFEDLREKLNHHSEYRLRREVEFYGKHGCSDAMNSCIQLMQTMENEERAIYLQMGWGCRAFPQNAQVGGV